MDNTAAQPTRASSTELIQQAIDMLCPYDMKAQANDFVSEQVAEAIELLELALEMIDVEKDAAFDRGVDYGLFNY
jgi:hypothetical protein